MADISLLVVADGIFSFGPQVRSPGSPDDRDVSFTVNTFLSILATSTSPSIAVTTATPFSFQATVTDLSVFDVSWLSGDEGTNYNVETSTGGPANPLAFIGDGEVAAVAAFMQSGGGVFATGDREGLGSLMCGLLPRVRTMRAWFSDNQSDDIPQQLSFPNGTSHPVLQSASGPITGFPDHLHEGQA